MSASNERIVLGDDATAAFPECGSFGIDRIDDERATAQQKRLPFRLVGTHRRVRFEDVLRFKENIDAERRKVLDQLAAEAQELKMGY